MGLGCGKRGTHDEVEQVIGYRDGTRQVKPHNRGEGSQPSPLVKMATSGVHLGRGDGDHPLKFRSGHQRREDVVGADRSRGW